MVVGTRQCRVPKITAVSLGEKGKISLLLIDTQLIATLILLISSKK